MEDEAEIARAVKYKRELKLDGGVLISNPIPDEYSLDNDYINGYIDNALKEADKQHIKGKDVTPFLLKAIADATENKSLDANIALVYNNAKIGARIAKEYAKLNEKENREK